MSFETSIADHMLTLKQSRYKLQRERTSMFHQCDCEYCDVDGLLDEYTENDLDAMDRRIDEVNLTIRRLKDHAKIHGIELEAKT